MERSAATDDVVTCPICHARDHLRIRWIPEIDHRVHERTELGCDKCNTWFSAKEDRWCFAEWNNWACEQWAQSGHKVPHAELYRLLLQEARKEQIERTAAKAVSQYLAENIAGHYPMVAGDRFKSEREPKGVWSAVSIEAVYGTNTGPFCIIKARKVLPSGILGDITHEFWSNEFQLKKLRPFWKPSTWRQVKAGDPCILNGSDGVVVHADTSARMAVINIDGTQFEVKKLSELLVPVLCVENGI